MKSLYIFGVVAVLALANPLRADEPPALAPLAPAKWSIRLEVMMVALPEDKALSMLPDLFDATKVDAACAQLTEAIQHKEARLTGYPVTTVIEGQQAASGTNSGKIYPTQFQPPQQPTNFEYRNVGPQLQVDKCSVLDEGRFIQAEVQAECVDLLKFDSYDTGERNKDGSEAKIIQPLFFHAKSTTTLAAPNGRWLLLGVHPLVKPKGETELFLLRATATALH